VPEAEIDRRVAEIARLLDLTRPIDRKATRLTPTQAEDLARPRPGALRRQRHPVRRAADRHRPALKWVLRSQLKAAAPPLGYTMIYVTHDQTEALTFADRSW
jgi:glycerol transport system ATP-binding protein